MFQLFSLLDPGIDLPLRQPLFKLIDIVCLMVLLLQPPIPLRILIFLCNKIPEAASGRTQYLFISPMLLLIGLFIPILAVLQGHLPFFRL